ncbi:hydroxyacid dehydrogenase [Acuticoccus sediminis]|uniref:Hydroxyacid dehydrogenase n=2 Tax=Acuticoccus sediminis TaxID=2184697 RepID=A0A8B2NWK5_9HYPH|nr:hydroxyacid dehydrogenase [Acuticoccus sediminis]
MAEGDRLIGVDALTRVVADILAAYAMPADDARFCAECLIEADLRGVSSHGIARLPTYARRLREGVLNPAPRLAVTERMPVAAHVDGDNGIGYVVGRRAMDLAIEKAQMFGVGLAAASRSNHYGMSSLYVHRALQAGLASFVFTNAAPTMPVWGGRDPVLGTNPLAMGAPGPTPFVLDMATSVAAKGKVRRALARGETIPEGWALDGEGRPTTDPAEALKGVVLPMAGPKGSGIAVMIDVFAGVMSGAAFGDLVVNQNDDFTRGQDVGHFFMAMRPDLFVARDAYDARAGQYRDRIKGGRKAAGFEEILLPGEPESRRAERCRREGLPLSANEIASIEAEAGKAGVAGIG